MGLFGWIRKHVRRTDVAALEVMGTPIEIAPAKRDWSRPNPSERGTEPDLAPSQPPEAVPVDAMRLVEPGSGVVEIMQSTSAGAYEATATLDLAGMEIPANSASAVQQADWFDARSEQPATIHFTPQIERTESAACTSCTDHETPAAAFSAEASESAAPQTTPCETSFTLSEVMELPPTAEPMVGEPMAVAPAATQSMSAEPRPVEALAWESMLSGATTAEPVVAESMCAASATAESVSAESVSAESVSAEPTTPTPAPAMEALIPDADWAEAFSPMTPAPDVIATAFLDEPIMPNFEPAPAVAQTTSLAQDNPVIQAVLAEVADLPSPAAVDLPPSPVTLSMMSPMAASVHAPIAESIPSASAALDPASWNVAPAVAFDTPAASEQTVPPSTPTLEPMVAAPIAVAIAEVPPAAPTAPATPAVLQQASAPAAEVAQRRDPIVEDLIMTLMDEARKRADSAVTAYTTLADKVGEYATRSNRTARTAWTIVGALSLGIFVGGIWGSYKLARATSVAESLQEKVEASTVAVAERDMLRNQLSLSHAAEFESSLELRAAHQAAAHAEVELQSYQHRETDETHSRQTGYAPSTQPSQPQATLPLGPESSTVSPQSQAIPVPTARPSDAWATLLGQ